MKILWLTIMAFTVALSAGAAGAEEKSGTLKTGVRSIVSDLVSAARDLAAGFNEGVDKGLKGDDQANSARGAANQAEFKALGLGLKVTGIKFLEPGEVELALALKNPNEFPVRLTNLAALGNVALVDRDGFSYALSRPAEQGRDVIALGRSSTRLRFFFSEVEGRPETFRLFDIDVPVN